MIKWENYMVEIRGKQIHVVLTVIMPASQPPNHVAVVVSTGWWDGTTTAYGGE